MTTETRNRILETAAKLFHEQGFAATGVATILREAEVNSGSLYHFFHSKDELLKGVLQWYREHVYPLIMAPLETQEPDPLKRIFALLEWYREFLQERECRMGCPVGNLALEVSDTYPEIRPLVDSNFQTWVDILTNWIRELEAELPPEVQPEPLARFVLTVMEGGVMQARAAGNLQPYDDSVAELRRYFEHLFPASFNLDA